MTLTEQFFYFWDTAFKARVVADPNWALCFNNAPTWLLEFGLKHLVNPKTGLRNDWNTVEMKQKIEEIVAERILLGQ